MNKRVGKEKKAKKSEKPINVMKEHTPILTAYGWEKKLKESRGINKTPKK